MESDLCAVKTKQQKKGKRKKGISILDTISLWKISEILTYQFVRIQIELLQMEQFYDFWRNMPYSKVKTEKQKKELVILSLPSIWHRKRCTQNSLKYGPVSSFWCKYIACKFANLPISGGIGPVWSQDKTEKRGELVSWFRPSTWRRDMDSVSLGGNSEM